MKISRGKIDRPQKAVIYGQEGIGKTTLASKFPDPVFTDVEGGTCHLDVARTPTPQSWDDLHHFARSLASDPQGFKTWVIDTLDWAEKLCIRHVCVTGGQQSLADFGYGRGHVMLEEYMLDWLSRLDECIAAGLHVVLVAHAHHPKVDLPEQAGSFDRWELKTHRKTAGVVKEWADLVLFAYYEIDTFTIEDGAKKTRKAEKTIERKLRTVAGPAWEAKNRHGLADNLPLTWDSIKKCFPAHEASPVDYTSKSGAPLLGMEKTKKADTVVVKLLALAKESDVQESEILALLSEKFKSQYTALSDVPQEQIDYAIRRWKSGLQWITKYREEKQNEPS